MKAYIGNIIYLRKEFILNKDDLVFAAPGPYPEINLAACNPAYARTMLDNMAGECSEMNAVSLYFYNNLITNEKYKDVAYIFHKISIVEMHHLQIFGEIACCLGADPRLWTQNDNNHVYWSPEFNTYSWSFKKLMHQALQNELDTIEIYKKQMCDIDNSCIAANLQRIIEDEEVHVKIFKDVIKKYCPK